MCQCSTVAHIVMEKLQLVHTSANHQLTLKQTREHLEYSQKVVVQFIAFWLTCILAYYIVVSIYSVALIRSVVIHSAVASSQTHSDAGDKCIGTSMIIHLLLSAVSILPGGNDNNWWSVVLHSVKFTLCMVSWYLNAWKVPLVLKL